MTTFLSDIELADSDYFRLRWEMLEHELFQWTAAAWMNLLLGLVEDAAQSIPASIEQERLRRKEAYANLPERFRIPISRPLESDYEEPMRQVRSAAAVVMFSSFEHQLYRIATELPVCGVISLRDFAAKEKGGRRGFQSTADYLEKELRLNPKNTLQWAELRFLQVLRDRIVHGDGIVKNSELRKLQSQCRARSVRLVEDTDGVIHVGVTDKYLRKIFKNIHVFFSLFRKSNRAQLDRLSERYVKNEVAAIPD